MSLDIFNKLRMIHSDYKNLLYKQRMLVEELTQKAKDLDTVLNSMSISLNVCAKCEGDGTIHSIDKKNKSTTRTVVCSECNGKGTST